MIGCRLFFWKDDNHQVAGATIEQKRLMQQKGDCCEVLPGGVSGGISGAISTEDFFTIIGLPDVPVADMLYLKLPRIGSLVDARGRLIETDYRHKTTNLSALRGGMNALDKRKFDGDFPAEPSTGLRPVPEMSKGQFESQVRNR